MLLAVPEAMHKYSQYALYLDNNNVMVVKQLKIPFQDSSPGIFFFFLIFKSFLIKMKRKNYQKINK